MKKLGIILLALVLLVGMFTGAVAEEKKSYKMFIITRQAGDAYWDCVGQGAVDWGTANGHEVINVSPTEYDAAAQVAAIQDCITQKPDAILLFPVSNEACEPILKQAMADGIEVITCEAPDMTNVNWDIEVQPNQGYGELWMQKLAEAMNYEGEYVAMVGSLQNTGEMTRINFAIDYQKANYPNMTLVTDIVEPTSGSADAHLALFKEMLATYPNLKGLLAHESVAQAALAIEEAGKTGKCFTAGYALPSEVHQYIENGSCVASLIADIPTSGASLAALAARDLDGLPIETGMDLGLFGFDACTLTGKVVEANGVLVVDKSNHLDYNY